MARQDRRENVISTFAPYPASRIDRGRALRVMEAFSWLSNVFFICSGCRRVLGSPPDLRVDAMVDDVDGAGEFRMPCFAACCIQQM